MRLRWPSWNAPIVGTSPIVGARRARWRQRVAQLRDRAHGLSWLIQFVSVGCRSSSRIARYQTGDSWPSGANDTWRRGLAATRATPALPSASRCLASSPPCDCHVTPPPGASELVEFYHELTDCQKCPLAGARTQVVFGTGNADADLMFVGEAPGFHEDQQGKPFVGRAGKLLDELLGGDRARAASSASSPTCSSAGRRATAIRSRSRSRPARAT